MKIAPNWLCYGYCALFTVLPWSIEFDLGSYNLNLPSEPLIGALGLGLIWLFFQYTKVFLRVLLSNILLQTSLLYLGWMAVSACYSTLPMVSWKYWLVEVGQWWVFAVGISVCSNIWRRALPWFVYSVGGVAVYTLVHHGFYHFRADQALLAPMPFFPDHTMWSAVLAMVLFLGGRALCSSENALSATLSTKIKGVNALFPEGLKAIPPSMARATCLLLLVALIASTCRAAWASVLLAGAVLGFLYLERKGRLLLLVILLFAGFYVAGKMPDSIGQDVSAMERLNRWHCALRMAYDRPILGFGPGTYQYKYLDYQKEQEMTRISLRIAAGDRGPDTYGRGGGAHSEYLRALAETGWPGLVFWLGMLGVALVAGFVSVTLDAGAPPLALKILQNADLHLKLPALLALITFLSHGLVNDFMHDGRIAALVWGCLALIFATKKEDSASLGFSG